ncbi:MAG TPA: hypothetical protein VHW90_15105 [Stellaceae bacterium]|jgi:hypothetical protein|nr:hypothetical protein [Stellaceae bacterium]
MSLLASTTLAALLISNPATSDADVLAVNGGFLLGNAQRCGIQSDRVVRAGALVHRLIEAASQDADEKDEATTRFAEFFLVSAFPDKGKEKTFASCKAVASEFQQLEKHQVEQRAAEIAAGSNAEPQIRAGDGE